MRQTSNMPIYSKGDIRWVDRRTGGPDHSPLWDDANPSSKTSNKAKGASIGVPGLMLIIQSAGVSLYLLNLAFESLSWLVGLLWLVMTIIGVAIFAMPYVRNVAFAAMSGLYAYWTYQIGPHIGLDAIWLVGRNRLDRFNDILHAKSERERPLIRSLSDFDRHRVQNLGPRVRDPDSIGLSLLPSASRLHMT